MLNALKLYFGLGPVVNARIIARGNIFEGGYAQYVQRTAQKYGLLGWMKSNPGGLNEHIEMEIQGPQIRIEKVMDLMRKGTPLSKVHKIEVEWRGPNPRMTAFRVRT